MRRPSHSLTALAAMLLIPGGTAFSQTATATAATATTNAAATTTAAAAATTETATTATTPATAVPTSTQLRIMPLGDAMTAGSDATDLEGRGGYRAVLEERLVKAGIDFDFVGNRTVVSGDGSGFLVDSDHQGYPAGYINGNPPGTTTVSIRNAVRTGAQIRTANPDIILTLVGANNVSYTPEPLGSAASEQQLSVDLNALFAEVATQAPTAKVFVGTLPPTNQSAEVERAPNSKIEEYNEIVRRVVTSRAEGEENIELCEIYWNIDDPFNDINIETPKINAAGQRLPDGVSPSEQGYAKIANAWFWCIQNEYWTNFPFYVDSTAIENFDGWRSSPKYGDFYDGGKHGEGWKYHSAIGWIWLPEVKGAGSDEELWFYHAEWGWIFTSGSSWPSFYRFDQNEWYFLDLSNNDGFVFRNNSGTWVQIPK